MTNNKASDGPRKQIIRDCPECKGLPFSVVLKSLSYDAWDKRLVVTVIDEHGGQQQEYNIAFPKGLLAFRVMDESHFLTWQSELCTDHPPNSAVSEVQNSAYLEWFVQSEGQIHYRAEDLRHIEIVTPDDCVDVIIHADAEVHFREAPKPMSP